ncbi:Protein of unknown function [Pyronema omphalodes CBS 100304]|uniref:Uncharacterized protein n=1 Tax=Pyronema omphalodes (strain CBS 100304) TaxID=1076935 RepID=U4KTS7_PYROM|nr:Protein of unknown function [Pyronema omphalodes CBS 100304]
MIVRNVPLCKFSSDALFDSTFLSNFRRLFCVSIF